MKSRKHKSGKNECIKALEKKKWNKRSLKNSKVKQKDLEKLFKFKRKNQGLHLCENRKFFSHSYLNTKKMKMELNCGKAIEYVPTIIQALQMAQCYIV